MIGGLDIRSPQFLYMILFLPSLFGLVLLGDGVNKVIHEDWGGLAGIILGIFCVVLVVYAYLFFSNFLGTSGVGL